MNGLKFQLAAHESFPVKLFAKSAGISIALLSAFHACAMAGMPAGPYVAWVNLHEDAKPRITKTIREFLKTQQVHAICDGFLNGWIVYTRGRPARISNELVCKAFSQQDAASRQTLIKIMKAFKDKPDVNNGLDGVIAYSEAESPRIISLDTCAKNNTIKVSKERKRYRKINQRILCSTLPEVYRK